MRNEIRSITRKLKLIVGILIFVVAFLAIGNKNPVSAKLSNGTNTKLIDNISQNTETIVPNTTTLTGNDFTVTFKNRDDSTLNTYTYSAGDYIGLQTDPTYTAEIDYTYTFRAWYDTWTETEYSSQQVHEMLANRQVSNNYNLEQVFYARYNVKEKYQVNITCSVENKTYAPSDSYADDTYTVSYTMTRNDGFTSMLLYLYYDTEKFEVDSVNVIDTNTDNVSDILAKKYIINYSS